MNKTACAWSIVRPHRPNGMFLGGPLSSRGRPPLAKDIPVVLGVTELTLMLCGASCRAMDLVMFSIPPLAVL